MNNGRIPIIIGVTGHRMIPEEAREAVREKVRMALQTVRKGCPNSPVRMLNSLAEGADMICAEAALAEGIPVYAVLPMSPAEYEKDFRGVIRENFRDLLAQSEEIRIENGGASFDSNRDECYRQAGVYIADHCHILMALWDGTAGDVKKCGTADIVAYHRNGIRESETFHPREDDILWIPVQREKGTFRNAGEKAWQNVSRLTEKGTVVGETDRYNRDVIGAGIPSCGDSELDIAYRAADTLSLRNARKHRAVLACLTVFATVFALAVLLYSDANLKWMILVCGLMMLCMAGATILSRRKAHHKKYMQYRLLAEGIRVQQYLTRTAPGSESAGLLPWRWRMDAPWVARALSAVAMEIRPEEIPATGEEWIRSQKKYHEEALIKTERKARLNGRIVTASLTLTILLYAAMLALEVFGCGLNEGTVDHTKQMIKYAMGTLSAITLFTGSYYGKLSLDETTEDHARMAALYERMEEAADQGIIKPDLYRELAREELEENAGWYAYMSINKPDITL